MKKLFVFLLAFACVCASCLTKIEENPLYCADANAVVCYVSKSEFENAETVLRTGDLFFNYFSLENADSQLERGAIAVQFEGNFGLEDVISLLDAEIISISTCDDMTILCAWTKYGSESFQVNGMEANCQIAVKEDEIIVGLPAIYTSF